MRRIGAFVRADAAGRSFASPVRELRAGAMLRPAGCSSGRGDCARGGRSARRCGSGMGTVFVLRRSRGSLGMSCARITPAVRFCWNVLRSITPAVRFYRGVLRPITSAVRFYRGVLRSVHACLFSFCQKKRDGLRYLAFLFRRGRAAGLCVLKRLCGHPTWRVHFWFVRFLTAARGTRGTEPAARCKCAFSQSHWLCNVFRGESVGAARPKPAPRSH